MAQEMQRELPEDAKRRYPATVIATVTIWKLYTDSEGERSGADRVTLELPLPPSEIDAILTEHGAADIADYLIDDISIDDIDSLIPERTNLSGTLEEINLLAVALSAMRESPAYNEEIARVAMYADRYRTAGWTVNDITDAVLQVDDLTSSPRMNPGDSREHRCSR